MMPFFVKSMIAHVLLTLGAMGVMLLVAWIVLQLQGTQLDWFAPAQARTSYFACWRALLYTLIFAGWTVALRLRQVPADQQRLNGLGLIGFSSIILVELSRV